MSFGSLIVSTIGIIAGSLFLGFHKVDEGHIGLYYFGGILEKQYTEPGFNWMIPFITKFENVQITVSENRYCSNFKIQTDEVKNIPCGTSGGILIYFEKIEVVNRLIKELAIETVRNYTSNYDKIWIYDKIHHEINQFCSKHSLQEIYIDQFEQLDEQLVTQLQIDLQIWAPGIEIIGIRVTKPKIPNSIRKNFEEMEQQRTNYLLESERQNVLLQQARSKGRQEIIQAQSELDVAQITVERQIAEKLSQQEMAAIEDQIYFAEESASIDSDMMAQRKQLETAQMKLTKEYLQNEAIIALGSNVKFYIGDRVPQYMGGGVFQ